MKGINLLIPLVVFCFTSIIKVEAQEEAPEYYIQDVIYFKNSTYRLTGVIEAFYPDSLIVFRLQNDELFRVDPDRIKKIKQIFVDKNGRKIRGKAQPGTKAYAFKERGWYGYVGGAINTGQVAGPWIEDVAIGFDFNVSSGYQFNRMLGVGLGLGAHYYYGRGRGVYPIFTEMRGYFFPQWNTPYYNVAVGYGIALKDEDRDIQAAQGGLFLYPALGFRLGGNKAVNFIFDAGVKLQHVNYQTTAWQINWERGEEIPLNDNHVRYVRWTLRTGVIF